MKCPQCEREGKKYIDFNSGFENIKNEYFVIHKLVYSIHDKEKDHFVCTNLHEFTVDKDNKND